MIAKDQKCFELMPTEESLIINPSVEQCWKQCASKEGQSLPFFFSHYSSSPSNSWCFCGQIEDPSMCTLTYGKVVSSVSPLHQAPQTFTTYRCAAFLPFLTFSIPFASSSLHSPMLNDLQPGGIPRIKLLQG